MENTLILALIGLSLTIFTAYNFFALGKFGVSSSLSMTAYKFAEINTNLRYLFTITLFLMGFSLMPAWLEISEGTTYQFLSFLTCASILFVGATPNFLDKGVHIIHSVAAYSSAVFGLTWMFIYSPFSWIIIPIAAIVILMSILTKTIKTSYEYWLEMIAFYSIYFSLILQLIQ